MWTFLLDLFPLLTYSVSTMDITYKHSPQPLRRDHYTQPPRPKSEATPLVDYKPVGYDQTLTLQRPHYLRNNEYETVYVQNDFKPRLPTFEGKIDTWEPFLMQLDLLSHSYKWSDKKFREQLIFALRGEALIFASTLPLETTENTEKLLRSMRQRFGQCVLPETYRANLYTIKKQPKENLQEYSARVNHLMFGAYPGIHGTGIYNSLAVEHFLRGLSDQKLAYEILVKKPRDLSKAVEMLIWHEACYSFTKQATISGIGEDSNNKKSKRNIKNRLCYNCRRRGHEAVRCPADKTHHFINEDQMS